MLYIFLFIIFIGIIGCVFKILKNHRNTPAPGSIEARVAAHYKYLQEQGYEVVAVYLQGSQNYGLDEYSQEYQSDVDVKAIVLPHFRDFVKGQEPISTTLVMKNNEHIDVKDIRLMFEMFKKQNLSYLELLFSGYRVVNPKYHKLMAPVYENRERIAAANQVAFAKCAAGMALEKRKALCHPYPTLLDKIQKYGFDGKQLSHCARIADLLDQWMQGIPLEECYWASNPHVLINFKKQRVEDGSRIMTVEEAIVACDMYCKIVQDMKEQIIANAPPVDTEAFDILDEVKYRILRKKFKEDINGFFSK